MPIVEQGREKKYYFRHEKSALKSHRLTRHNKNVSRMNIVMEKVTFSNVTTKHHFISYYKGFLR